MSHLRRDRDLDGRKRLFIAVCPYLGGPTVWYQTGDDGRLDARTLEIVIRALNNDGAVALFGYSDIEHTAAVATQIKDAS